MLPTLYGFATALAPNLTADALQVIASKLSKRFIASNEFERLITVSMREAIKSLNSLPEAPKAGLAILDKHLELFIRGSDSDQKGTSARSSKQQLIAAVFGPEGTLTELIRNRVESTAAELDNSRPSGSSKKEQKQANQLRKQAEALRQLLSPVPQADQTHGALPQVDWAEALSSQFLDQFHLHSSKPEYSGVFNVFHSETLKAILENSSQAQVSQEFADSIVERIEKQTLSRAEIEDLFKTYQEELLGNLKRNGHERNLTPEIEFLFPAGYLQRRIARPRALESARKAFLQHKKVVLFGEPGSGKTSLAYELGIELQNEFGIEAVFSISWRDVLGGTLSASAANLLDALRREIERNKMTPNAQEFMQLSSLEGVGQAANCLSKVLVVINDFEYGSENPASQTLTSNLLRQLEAIPIVRHQDQGEPSLGDRLLLIITTRPCLFSYHGKDYDLAAAFFNSEEDSNKTPIPPFAIAMEALSSEEQQQLIARCLDELGSFHETKDYVADIAPYLQEAVQGRPLTPLEITLVCELTARYAAKDNIRNRIDKWVHLLDPSAPTDQSVELAASTIRYFYSIVSLYDRLVEAIASQDRDVWEKASEALAVLSIGFSRTSMRLNLNLQSDEGVRLLLTMPSERGTPISGAVYELAHPTVSLLPVVSGRIAVDEHTKLVLENVRRHGKEDEGLLDANEQHLFELYCTETRVARSIDLPHEVIEAEPRACCLFLGTKLKAAAELAAYFAVPFSDSEEEDKPQTPGSQEAWDEVARRCKKLLAAEIGRLIRASCEEDSTLLLCACRLCETLYQQLDEWPLKDAIVTVLWSSPDLRPRLRGDSLLGWYDDPTELLTSGGLGREYLRQAEIVRRLEEAEGAPDLGNVDIGLLTQHFEKTAESHPGKDWVQARAAFASYLFFLGCWGSGEGDYSLQIEASQASQKVFESVGWPADAIRASLNLVTIKSLMGGNSAEIEDTDEIAHSAAGESCRQERIYWDVLQAYRLMAGSFADRGRHSRKAAELLYKAAVTTEEWPGDEWITLQIETLQEGISVMDGLAPSLQKWDDFLRKALPFYDRNAIDYCLSALLWNDLIVRIAEQVIENEIGLQDVLLSEQFKAPFFRHLHSLGATRFANLPADLKDLFDCEDRVMEALAQEDMVLYVIAATIDSYARVCLPVEEYEALVTEPTRAEEGVSIREMLDAARESLGTWRQAIARFFPNWDKLGPGNLPVPPFVAIDAFLYRAVPKGVTAWIERLPETASSNSG